MTACNCDWPGCQGQCHTGDSCPCHPAASWPSPDDAGAVEELAQALFDTQDERLHGEADGFGLGSHEADAAALLSRLRHLSENR